MLFVHWAIKVSQRKRTVRLICVRNSKLKIINTPFYRRDIKVSRTFVSLSFLISPSKEFQDKALVGNMKGTFLEFQSVEAKWNQPCHADIIHKRYAHILNPFSNLITKLRFSSSKSHIDQLLLFWKSIHVLIKQSISARECSYLQPNPNH